MAQMASIPTLMFHNGTELPSQPKVKLSGPLVSTTLGNYLDLAHCRVAITGDRLGNRPIGVCDTSSSTFRQADSLHPIYTQNIVNAQMSMPGNHQIGARRIWDGTGYTIHAPVGQPRNDNRFSDDPNDRSWLDDELLSAQLRSKLLMDIERALQDNQQPRSLSGVARLINGFHEEKQAMILGRQQLEQEIEWLRDVNRRLAENQSSARGEHPSFHPQYTGPQNESIPLGNLRLVGNAIHPPLDHDDNARTITGNDLHRKPPSVRVRQPQSPVIANGSSENVNRENTGNPGPSTESQRPTALSRYATGQPINRTPTGANQVTHASVTRNITPGGPSSSLSVDAPSFTPLPPSQQGQAHSSLTNVERRQGRTSRSNESHAAEDVQPEASGQGSQHRSESRSRGSH